MKDVVLLDGGLGQELYKRAAKTAHPLWSAKVMMDEPDLVTSVHQEFIRAGAQVITLNTYTCTPTRLRRDGHVSWFEKLQGQALRLARQARHELGEKASQVQLAGCLPPLIGSYTVETRSLEHLRAEYREIAQIQAEGVELFIIETISNIREAVAATEAALETGKPVLLSFSLSDWNPAHLRSGEPLTDALEAVSGYALRGLLLNCSLPETISESLQLLKAHGLPYGGYANGFTSVEALQPGGTVDVLSARTDLDEAKFTHITSEWVRKGASIVGGCCEVGPSYIAALHQDLLQKGYRIRPLA
ncbi:MAG: homocysteine S-methyltransferase family protein [Cyclonatronaceae bacterium]